MSFRPMFHVAFAAPLLLTALAACSGGDDPGATTGDPGGAGAGGAFDPGGEVTTYEVAAGPITIQPGDEQTVCLTRRLGNPEGGFVRRFRAQLTDGSHHMIVYRSTATDEILTPQPCSGFSGIFEGDRPIFIAQQPDATLVFPTDGGAPVGFEIDPDQMLRIEIHYINPTSGPLDVIGTAIVDTIPLASDVVRSDLAFWGTLRLNDGGEPPSPEIPPNSAGDTGMKYQAGLADTKSFALTTHQHHLGTRMRVWYTTGIDAAADPPVTDATNWADPPLLLMDPSLEFPAGAEAGLSDWGYAYRCEWNNTTPEAVGFGESANDEMCFLWHYYYPSQGFHRCMGDFCLLGE